jgi:hypothetical protein
LQVNVAVAIEPTGFVEIVAVVAPTHVATPAVASFALLIGALIGSDDTHTNACGDTTTVGTAHP